MNLHKQIFHNFSRYVVLRSEQKGKMYRTLHFNKMHASLMHMYCTAKVDAPKYFRAKLS